MYSRNYYEQTPSGVSLPENYVGTAFSESTETSSQGLPEGEHPHECSDVSASIMPKERGGTSWLSGILGDTPFLKGLRLPEIGVEEILIIATAAFLFLSKDGDRECAIMLLLLLLVN